MADRKPEQRQPPAKQSKEADERKPNPVDVHVGARVRMRRKLLGVSQEKLADALGLTFQQVQKYERGTNRISSSKLYEIGEFLQAPVSHFFDGYAGGKQRDAATPADGEQAMTDFIMTPEGVEMMRLGPKLAAKHRREVLALMRTMAGEEG